LRCLNDKIKNTMKKQNIRTRIFLLLGILLLTTNAFSQDPKFYIYLCFGQSNMEGQGTIETQDKTVDSRFQVMEAVDCTNLGRTKGSWYTAVPPLCRCWSGLSPADYFGRIMVDNLPTDVKVGVINVSVAGCKIELFDKDQYQNYVSTITEDWLLSIINEYDGNPYGYLVDVAKLAQKDGVIKGILLHQGESNTGDAQWPSKVNKIYNDLLSDLSLNPDSVPLLAGEVVNADQGGVCASMNSIIAKLPQTIPNSYVISSLTCTAADDKLHFDPAGYRKLGWRYGVKMLSLLGYDVTEPTDPTETKPMYFETECATVGTNWEILNDTAASNGKYTVIKSGMQSSSVAPSGTDDVISIPFSIVAPAIYNLYARVNCPTSSDDSYWIKMDNNRFTVVNGLSGSGWQWKKINSFDLTAGEHTFTISYRDDGAMMDKICISYKANLPAGKGNEALNICSPTVGSFSLKTSDGYSLGQNFPNPVNKKTSIPFEIPNNAFVSLKIFNMLGVEIAEIAGKEFNPGKHIVDFNVEKLPKGNYFYQITTDKFSATREMIILNK